MSTFKTMKDLRDLVKRIASGETIPPDELWQSVQSADKFLEQVDTFKNVYECYAECGAWRGLANALKARHPFLAEPYNPLKLGIIEECQHVGSDYWMLWNLLKQEFEHADYE